jgi:hypothetical protein
MVGKYNELAKTEKFKTFSASTIVKQLSAGMAIIILVVVLLTYFL